MTSQEQLAMQHRLEEVLGPEHAATLITMLPQRDDLATRADLAELRTELKGDMAELRTDMAEFKAEVKGEFSELRTELDLRFAAMDLKFASKDDLVALRNHFESTIHGMVKTFVKTQAATVVGMSAILFGLVRFF